MQLSEWTQTVGVCVRSHTLRLQNAADTVTDLRVSSSATVRLPQMHTLARTSRNELPPAKNACTQCHNAELHGCL